MPPTWRPMWICTAIYAVSTGAWARGNRLAYSKGIHLALAHAIPSVAIASRQHVSDSKCTNWKHTLVAHPPPLRIYLPPPSTNRQLPSVGCIACSVCDKCRRRIHSSRKFRSGTLRITGLDNRPRMSSGAIYTQSIWWLQGQPMVGSTSPWFVLFTFSRVIRCRRKQTGKC